MSSSRRQLMKHEVSFTGQGGFFGLTATDPSVSASFRHHPIDHPVREEARFARCPVLEEKQGRVQAEGSPIGADGQGTLPKDAAGCRVAGSGYLPSSSLPWVVSRTCF